MKALGKYGERDSFIVRFPLYDTHMRYLCHDDRTDVSGGFEILTDPSVLTTDHLNGGRSMYYYYLFKNSGLVEIWNEDVPKGDILLCSHSVFIPHGKSCHDLGHAHRQTRYFLSGQAA